jgi:phenol hydroxylase P1 protein
MSIDLKTASVEPLRRTFDHIADKIGPDKNATRYQEAVWGLQPDFNFHYRPTWDPQRELYDRQRTAIVMRDFDDLIDPRQYYYGTWTIQRGRQQDSQERNFAFVEKRGLLSSMDDEWATKIKQLVVPLRHVAWAANTNNSFIAAYGFGAPVTSACAMHMMDHLGIAQYISRIGLILGDNDASVLDAAKDAWLSAPLWQPLRELIEKSMVTHDWFELFVLQNLIIDGLLHPLIFERFDAAVCEHADASFAMLSEFMVEWFAESQRWVDAVLKLVGAESAHNQRLLLAWIEHWLPRVQVALRPLAEYAFDADGDVELDRLVARLRARAAKVGLES